jgi:gamma-glutamylcysteine synthetase
MGVNPNHAVNRYEPIHSERYRMLYRHLSSYPNYTNSSNAIAFHDVPNFGMFSCASQVQLDVEEHEIPEVINTFSKLEPLKALLFANSFWDKRPEYLINRDYFWQNSLHGFNPLNCGAYESEISSVSDIVKYISDMSMYCAERDGKYINFAPTPLREFFLANSITGEYFDGEKYREITFRPEIGDLKNLRSFKFEDLTFRGTVEFRSVCTQPVGEIMSSSAFHAGLKENLSEITRLLENDTVIYNSGYTAVQLRDMFSKRTLPDFADENELKNLLLEILEIAENGLKKRGMNENVFLKPLYFRAENLLSPAKQMLYELESGKSKEEIILEYASLSYKASQISVGSEL